jgi:pimeloyl-ACP methyl ester carboxylesterase
LVTSASSLQPRAGVIAIDPRSQGNLTKTDEGDTSEQRARDYRLLLTSLHLEPVILVGWSQGVQDVAAYVDQYGTTGVKAVVLVDSTISGGARTFPSHFNLRYGSCGYSRCLPTLRGSTPRG